MGLWLAVALAGSRLSGAARGSLSVVVRSGSRLRRDEWMAEQTIWVVSDGLQ